MKPTREGSKRQNRHEVKTKPPTIDIASRLIEAAYGNKMPQLTIDRENDHALWFLLLVIGDGDTVR
jgi:hypothetical protein